MTPSPLENASNEKCFKEFGWGFFEVGWRRIEPNLGDPDPPLNGLSHKPGNVMPELKGNRTKGDPHTLKLKSGPAENNARARHRKPLKTNKNPVEKAKTENLKTPNDFYIFAPAGFTPTYVGYHPPPNHLGAFHGPRVSCWGEHLRGPALGSTAVSPAYQAILRCSLAKQASACYA